MEKKIAFFSGDRPFMLPYFQREFPGRDAVGEDFTAVDAAVLLSSTDIYESCGDVAADENTPVKPSSEWKKREDEFFARASAAGVKAFVLRCAPIAGTGMTGAVRSLAEDIMRGIFLHFPGNEGRMSVVHASDVARAARMLVDTCPDGGVFNLTDGDDPKIDDLAEALAFRMNNKRISTLSTRPQQIIARILYGRRRYDSYTRTRLYSSARIQALGFEPQAVCNYMRTHLYDDSSL